LSFQQVILNPKFVTYNFKIVYSQIKFQKKSNMDIKEIQELIKIFDKSNLGELGIERNDFKINLKTKERETIVTTMSAPVAMQAAPVAAPQVAAAPAPVAAAPVADKGTVIKAPMVGTFYRSAGPDKEAFVKPGDKVKKGQVICIIEAMKLFNEIECEMDGTIVKVVADDASPVEFDQPLFIVE
jgi:acetyl-CoA carboxylase biotin carboxyl carrier protein